MKLTQVAVLGVSALFSLSALATEPTPTKTEGTPVAKAEGHTCEKCTKDGKECECKGECKCEHGKGKHKGHAKKDAKKDAKATETTPAAPATADATTPAAPTTEKK